MIILLYAKVYILVIIYREREMGKTWMNIQRRVKNMYNTQRKPQTKSTTTHSSSCLLYLLSVLLKVVHHTHPNTHSIVIR